MQTESEFPLINSHNNWGKLEEVWLGDVYPASWYDHLSPEVRDCFQEITERTKQDLQVIENKLHEFDVIVQRPRYNHINDYISDKVPFGFARRQPRSSQLIKPEITPRDYYITINNTLFAKKAALCGVSPWQHIIDEYKQKGGDVRRCHQPGTPRDQFGRSKDAPITGANTVRAGRDIYIDLNLQTNLADYSLVQKYLHGLFPDNRIHILKNGGHVDGCFALLKPEVILASRYFNSYEKTFPGWNRINTSAPEFKSHQHYYKTSNNHSNGKWWLADMKHSLAFNEHIVQHALTWVGDYTETFFEVNCLVIDEKNVIVLGEHDIIFRKMEEYGITAHSIPFRTRTFWDGGMHCLTLDIRRQTKIEDFFPERGDGPGMILIDPLSEQQMATGQ
jgi:hypothetical protein